GRGATGSGGVLNGKITGGFALTLNRSGGGVLIVNNTNNDWTGTTTMGAGTVRVGVNEVIPNGAGKGNLLLDGDNTGLGTTIFDLNGKTETVNGLSSQGVNGNITITNV